MKLSTAIYTTLAWVGAALAFNAGVYYFYGPQKALEFLTGYLIELSLSVDNLFVFLIIFSYFRVPPDEQARILKWGILGAQLMRGIFIFAGLALLNRFHWIIYIFGIFLVFTGIKLFIDDKKDPVDPAHNPVIKFVQRFCPQLNKFALVLIIVEVTDLLFAVDSIPAIFAISKDPMIVWTSNIFAIIGLRAMYFALAGIMPMFHLLHYALGAILTFVGVTMLTEGFWHVPIGFKLGFIAFCLLTAVGLSIRSARQKRQV